MYLKYGPGWWVSVYRVRFDPKDIWGTLAEANSWVYADIFETYLEEGTLKDEKK